MKRVLALIVSLLLIVAFSFAMGCKKAEEPKTEPAPVAPAEPATPPAQQAPEAAPQQAPAPEKK